jgi:hypothetical protein
MHLFCREQANLGVTFDNSNDIYPVQNYQECGSAHYAVDTTTSAAHVIIREHHYDLGKLNEYLKTPSIKKVSIYAQTVVLKQTMPVSVHFDLEIITREFWMDKQASFRFDFHTAASKLYDCRVRYSRSSVKTESLTIVRFVEYIQSKNPYFMSIAFLE